jgi:flavin-dependent dehydrogenase
MRIAVQGFLQKEDSSNFVETWPTKKGFLWKIPRKENTEYGIIENSGDFKKIFDVFLLENNLKLEGVKSAPIPNHLFIPKNTKITLCGDAAGLVKPWSGGGVLWGLTAADILLKNFPDFIKYYKMAKKTFCFKFIFSGIITKLVYFFGFKMPWILPKNFTIEGDFLKIFNKNAK